MNPEFINGPINYVKLKGTVDGNEKIIHLFFDKHFDLNEQTKCESFNSVDMTYYLYKLIKQSKEQLDFFMEIRMEQLEETNISNKRDTYIKETIQLFKSEFINNTNIKHSKTNTNVRLHYFDIRDHLDMFDLTKIVTHKIFKYTELFTKNNFDTKSKDKILFYVEQIKNKINSLIDNTKEIQNNKNTSYDKINNIQKYYLNKIINEYSNDALNININLFLKTHNTIILHSINETTMNIKYMVENKVLMDNEILDKNINELGEYIFQLFTLYTDIYLLRRIIDKNYVKKSVIYSGGAHSINFIFFLVKYYNFKIIKIHDSKIKNLKELTNKIKKEFYSYNILELFLQKKLYIQCIHWQPILIEDTISGGYSKYMKGLNKNLKNK